MKSTCCKFRNSGFIARQRGASLMVALFVLVVLSLLASSLVNVISDSSRSVAVEVYGTRALMAAQSGADLALVSLFPLDNGSGAGCSAATAYDGKSLDSQPGFNGCSIDISCAENTLPDDDGTTLYTVTVTGTCSAGNNAEAIRAQRVIQFEAKGLEL